MTFEKFLLDKKWLYAEKGLQTEWNILWALSQATVTGNVTGAGGIGDVELYAAGSPGLSAGIAPGTHGSGHQDLIHSDTGKLLPASGADEVPPPTQFRT